MIASKKISLNNIDVLTFEFGLKKNSNKKSFNISASHLDFEFKPQTSSEDETKHRGVFLLISTEKCNLVDFKIEVSFECELINQRELAYHSRSG